ncbi:MAG: isoprenylcysteine carboxylmethyltransferase family protein [Anaerolineales bacterium]
METFYLILTSVTWGVVHSWLAAHTTKATAARLFGAHRVNRWYRLAYNVFSALTFLPILLMLILLPDQPFYTVPVPWAVGFIAVQVLGAILLIVGVLQTDTLSFIGLRQLIQDPDTIPSALITHGLYRYVRHPLYTAGLMMLWFTPQVSRNLFTVFVVFTLYLIIGAIFEERKLLRKFGQDYANYRARTPMLIPFLRLP